MDRSEFIGILKRIEYKPNFRIRAREYDPSAVYGKLRLDISFKAVDVNNRRSETTIHSAHIVELENFRTCDQVLAYIRNLIKMMEIHEMHEWFFFDGRRVHNPHD